MQDNISENRSQPFGFPSKSAKKFIFNMNNVLLNNEFFYKEEEEKNENINTNFFKKDNIKDITQDNKNKINKDMGNNESINKENVVKKKLSKKNVFDDYNFDLKLRGL